MKNGLHPLLAGASLMIVVVGLRAAAPIVNLFLLAVLLTTSVAPVVLWQLRRGWSAQRAILLTVLGVVVGFILVNAVVENVLKPRFIGQELELSALEIFLSLLFWSWVLGAIGAIVAVPLTIVVKRLIPVMAAGISPPAAQSHSR